MEKRTPRLVGGQELKGCGAGDDGRALRRSITRRTPEPSRVPCTGPGDWTASRCRATGCRSRGNPITVPVGWYDPVIFPLSRVIS